MALTKTAADEALKEDYQPAIREQLVDINVTLSQIEQNDKDTDGRRAILVLHTGRNSGVGARAEGGTLPDAGAQSYTEERVGLRYNYGRIQITGPVMRATRSGDTSYIRALDSESKGIVKDVKRDVSRQLWGTSDGVLAVTGTTTSDNDVVLAANTSAVQFRWFTIGSKVDIGTVANPTAVASNREVTAVDPNAGTITIDGAAVTTSSSHRVYRAGAGGTSPQKELTGLPTIVNDSGTLFNVDPSVTPVWAATVLDNGGTLRAPVDSLIEEAVDEVDIKSGEMPNLLVTTHGVRRAYASGLKDQKRFNDTTVLKGGFSALKVSVGGTDLDLAVDRDAPANSMFGFNTSHLIHFVSSDWEFMDEDGALLSRVPNQDAYEATLFKYHEVATDERQTHFRISDLTGD